MKALLLATLILVCIVSATAQETPTADSLYIVTYTTGPAWDVAKLPTEQPYFTDHSANLGKLRKEGVIKAGARYAEKGIIFLSAISLKAAKEIVFTDPAVVNKLFNADVQKVNIFYDGCLEKAKKTN
jgi:uncharacterized protein YciI